MKATKYLFFLALSLLFVSCGNNASKQQEQNLTETYADAKSEIMANIDRAGGVYCPYPEGQPSPAAAPKGYKPFYLTHIGRHGSRYALGSHVYTDLYKVWSEAAAKDALTPEGQAIWEAYENLFPSLEAREGKLTLKGQQQLRQIGSQIHRDFPELFKGKTHVSALSTSSNRVIVSMMCMLDQMRLLDPDFTFDIDYGKEYYTVLVPESTDNPKWVARKPFSQEINDKYDSFSTECFDQEPFLKKWFKTLDLTSREKEHFMYQMQTLVNDIPDLDFAVSDTIANIFTAEDRYNMWRIQNYSDYLYTARAPGVDQRRCVEMSVLVKDMIDKFEEDMEEGNAMRLRFSHDTALMPLISYLGVNGMDAEISDPHEVEQHWRNYSVCMGCNFQMVFFRKGTEDILIQVLLNGFQATLPLPEAAPGFYRWEDFKEKFNHLEV